MTDHAERIFVAVEVLDIDMLKFCELSHIFSQVLSMQLWRDTLALDTQTWKT